MDRLHPLRRIGRQERIEMVLADVVLGLGATIARPGAPDPGEGEQRAIRPGEPPIHRRRAVRLHAGVLVGLCEPCHRHQAAAADILADRDRRRLEPGLPKIRLHVADVDDIAGARHGRRLGEAPAHVLDGDAPVCLERHHRRLAVWIDLHDVAVVLVDQLAVPEERLHFVAAETCAVEV